MISIHMFKICGESISKHLEIIFKSLKLNGVTGDLLNILIDCLKERKQRVVLSGQHSAGVPRGSILGPLNLY